MKERLEPLCHLGDFLDNNELIFHYNKKFNKYSLVQADYLLENSYMNQIIYLFLGAREEHENEQMCRTFFLKHKLDYTSGQEKYTLLKKEKINIETGEVQVQYNRL